MSANVCGTSIILVFAFATIQDDTGHVAIATPAPTSPSTISDLSNITIGMERNMCMGTCPVYSLEIFGNGTLVYNGERFVNVTGRQISSIPEDEVKELVEEFYKINYFSLNDTFD
ncbi:MAG TPA: DUF6438 domain-containing protein, partial [Nitrososphaeraceae archaeon]|nr:DUF6438 domain-containing protein [Nitrososphaeraceae archaeon]